MQGRGLSFISLNLIFSIFSQAPSLSLSTSFSLQKTSINDPYKPFHTNLQCLGILQLVSRAMVSSQEWWIHGFMGGFDVLWIVCQFWFLFSLVDLVLLFFLVFLWYFLAQKYSRIISHHLVSFQNLFCGVQKRFLVYFLLAV